MERDIRSNLRSVEARITAACERSGRSRDEITLVAVSKTFSAEDLDEAIRAGIADLGENRVQELKTKALALQGRARFHLIGHLQSNKAKDAVMLFDVIQTIDSASLARRVDRFAAEAGRSIEALIQVNVGGELQKSGVPPAEVESLARVVRSLEHVTLAGLMAIPPVANDEKTRQYFRETKRIRDELEQRLGPGSLPELSIGMSDDYEVAIEEGATMIRVGRAIFGERG